MTNRKPGKRRQQWNWSLPRQRPTITAVGQSSDRRPRRTVLTNDDDACQRRRTTSTNNNDVRQRWSRTTVSKTGHRDVAALEAITYQASRQLSTSSTTADIHFRFDKLLIIFIFQQIIDKMVPIRYKNTHKTLFLTIFSKIRRAQPTISLNVSTRCEHDDVQRRSPDAKRGGLYIEILPMEVSSRLWRDRSG